MADTLVINGTSYSFPDTGDEQWGDNVNAWATAVSAHLLQKTGGTFTLSADVNFGASFGLKAAYFSSRSTAPSSGLTRYGNAEYATWRNAGNTATYSFGVNASDRLVFDGPRINITSALSGSDLRMDIDNSSDTASSGALFGLSVAGSSAGDPYFSASVVSGGTMAFGLDNSDSDAICLTAASTLNGTNLIRATSAGVAIRGTNTNDNATTAFVGERVSDSASGTSIATSNTYQDGTSISLTAGDWDVTAVLTVSLNGATCTACIVGVSTTSGNSSSGLTAGDTRADFLPPTSNSDSTCVLSGVRMSLSGTTTVYLKVLATFSAGNPTLKCRLSARRVR